MIDYNDDDDYDVNAYFHVKHDQSIVIIALISFKEVVESKASNLN